MEERNRDVYEGFMEKYPILFQDKDKSPQQTCMCWGIECPEGWLELLTELCNKLEFLNNTACKQFNVAIVATQCKEKFGGLRFYYDILPLCEDENFEKTYHIIYELVGDIIRMAEIHSENICQVCGKTLWTKNERKVSTGWIGFYCKECAEKYNISTFENEENGEEE